MPSILITTSRKTSNRVRSFIRDLSVVLPDSFRFNRGGMSQSEIVSRIQQTSANAALIVTLSKGNPGSILVLQSDGTQQAEIILESAALRREVEVSSRIRVDMLDSVLYDSESSNRTRNLAVIIASLMDVEPRPAESADYSCRESPNGVRIWFQDLPNERILWTHYSSGNAVEIGPRIRVKSVRAG